MSVRATMLAAAAMLAACDMAEREVTIRFRAEIAGDHADCASNKATTLSDLRFFVHDVALVDASGVATPLALTRVTPWQSGRVALIDLETGLDHCRDGTRGFNATVTGRAPNKPFIGLAFTLGVPFELNHADPITAPAPLDDTAMHWHWLGGYKFLRAALTNAGATSWLHLGSTGCRGTAGRIDSCAEPNRVRVELAHFDAASDAVVIDVAALVPSSSQAAPSSHCMADAATPACALALRNLGLTEPHHAQQVFHAGS